MLRLQVRGVRREARETVRRGVMRGSGEGFQTHIEQSLGSASITSLPTRPACRPIRTFAAGRISGTLWSPALRPTQTVASATSSSSSSTSG